MSGANAKPTLVGRLAYVPKPDGPHARLGLLWFIVACGACALGTIAVAAVFAVLAAVSAMQNARAWIDAGRNVSPILLGCAALAAPLGALVGPVGFGAGVVIGVVAVIVGGSVVRSDILVGLRSVVLPALAAGSVVLIGRADMSALVILLVFISAYEIGDYLMGAEAGSVFEGPLSGIAAVIVVTFVEAVFQLGPFETRAGWVFGALAAALAPLGAPLASALAPSAQAAGPALRRLDAWLVVAPVWGLMLSNYLSQVR